ncbi:MAG: twin-arginine translocase subunit TatC [candidate division Zixibacteria bacterium]|nr:twin-arginine translocase subunit TatC [candidate division Zixibacteria bacterium]
MVKNQKEMTFVEHLDELRSRLIVCLASVLALSAAVWFFSKEILDFITRDIPKVYFTAVTEAFGVRIKISMWGGLIAGVPVILYQAWQFVVPGLLERESKAAFGVIFFGTFFFAAGGAFCFTVVLPVAIQFLLSFQTEKLAPIITVGDYVGFVAFMIFAFGAVFELPVVAFFLGKLGLVDAPMLASGRRWAVVIILVVAAAVTPTPDLFSQIALAVPLYFLYEISIWVVRLTGRKP